MTKANPRTQVHQEPPMTLTVNVHEAKTHLSKLLEQAHAGQESILAKAGKPYARLMPLAPTPARRQPGRLAGQGSVEFTRSPLSL
jgi:prevent-host-death family protein